MRSRQPRSPSRNPTARREPAAWFRTGRHCRRTANRWILRMSCRHPIVRTGLPAGSAHRIVRHCRTGRILGRPCRRGLRMIRRASASAGCCWMRKSRCRRLRRKPAHLRDRPPIRMPS
ncbi:hypothetical protein BG22_01645 [Bifidobacterium sp. UTBIF-78]|nr:hypothetical protein BG22_01645 [Bifidobacterium sp. UTBIF-78]